MPCALPILIYKENKGAVILATGDYSKMLHPPAIGHWFRRRNGTVFEVVAIDEDDATVGVQQFDGTIDEYELDRWPELLLIEVSPPEDWSGSVDMDPEDLLDPSDEDHHNGYHNPLAFLDKL